MNYSNITAFAASVAATNASAGISTFNIFNMNKNASNIEKRKIMCIHNMYSNENIQKQNSIHQIGTNLADLAVCWHKMNENCKKCKGVIYDGKLKI